MKTAWALVVVLWWTVPLEGAEGVDYVKQVKPILATKCFACHGALRQEAGLRLDALSLIHQGGDSGPVLDPDQVEQSLLWERITAESAEQRMPPEGEGERLSDSQLAALRGWIEQGALGPQEAIPPDPREHWAYQPVRRPDVPAADGHPIDALLAASFATQGLTPAPPADRATLVRRVYLDLIGLPPTRAELQAFVANEDDRAYEQLVAELLQRPQHGERWARHWMDIWRYSDWAGFGEEIRYSQRNIWHWRDWIIESLNADKGYDQMVLEMLAADELSPDDPSAIRATGFLARNWYKFDRNIWLDDTVEHTSRALLGVTMRCARCHDHKYDPISQHEYYQLRAVFEPYEVRTDPVVTAAGEPAAGFPRVYDANLDAVTHLFLRGDPKRPAPEQPMLPGTPEVLGGAFDIQPRPLPLVSYYPAAAAPLLPDATKRAEQAVVAARQQLDSVVVQSGTDATATSDPRAAEGLRSLGEKRVAAAEAKLVALRARADAERAKYCDADLAASSAAGSAAESANSDAALEHQKRLQQVASQAEREAQRLDAQVQLAEIEQQLADFKAQPMPASEAEQEAARKKLAELEQQDQTARERLRQVEQSTQAAAADATAYEPLGPVYPSSSSGRRLALARWMVDRRHPLTARVAVNHLWSRHFGSPLVASVDDLGLRAERPRQAELLDFLASELMDHHWSMKHLHRLLVTSQAYRRASHTCESAAQDPENQYFWRMNATRMPAETVRDSILFVAGSLDLTLFGPEVDHTQGMVSFRRSLYFHHSHEKQMLFLQTFDAANPRECYRREVSIRPQQALALLNSSLALQQARQLTARLAKDSQAPFTDEAFVKAAFETILSRGPRPAEQATCVAFLQDLASRLQDTSQLVVVGSDATGVAASNDPAQRARENLVLALFSHHDFVTIH
jgi:hypothetical protein